MSKNLKRIKQKERQMVLDALHRAARSMPQTDPVITFITTVLTESEQILIGRRILIAQMILEGKKQAEVIFELGVSPNTFSRTRKWLRGQIPEYDTAIKEYHARQKRLSDAPRHPNQTTVPFSLTTLKKKYPAHFLLLSLFEQAKGEQ